MQYANKKLTKWYKTKAKVLLKYNIISGDDEYHMQAREVWMMRHKYYAYENSNFLRIFVIFARTKNDHEAFLHYRVIMRSSEDDANVSWYRSDNARYLKEDIQYEKHIGVNSAVLYASRIEYQYFDL